MKKFIFLFLACTIIISCDTQKSILDSGKTYESFRGFEPTDPIEYDDKIQIADGVQPNDSLIYKEIKLLSTEQVLSFLNNETVLVSIGQLSAKGGITYLPVTVSAKSTSYKITMDYMKFATLASKDRLKNKINGFRRVGVGLRLISLITTKEAGINIGDLSSIGLAAKAGKLTGTLMIEVVGIKSKDVTTLLPLPSEINQSTIQNAMQALATIKSKIYDKDTKLYPQVMAIKNEIDTDSINKVNNSQVKSKNDIVNDIVNENKLKIQLGSNKEELVEKLENQAFSHLFENNINQALEKFKECYTAYPKYHNVDEILKLLQKEKKSLSDKNSNKWIEVYKIILEKYKWGLSSDIVETLKLKTK